MAEASPKRISCVVGEETNDRSGVPQRVKFPGQTPTVGGSAIQPTHTKRECPGSTVDRPS